MSLTLTDSRETKISFSIVCIITYSFTFSFPKTIISLCNYPDYDPFFPNGISSFTRENKKTKI